MKKPILLARPHPFIIDEMKPFLSAEGFEGRPLGSFDSLPDELSGVAGAVISMALASPIGVSAADVLKRVRQEKAGVPVLLVSLLSFDKAQNTVKHLLEDAGVSGQALGISSSSEQLHKLGTPSAYLYLGREDLSQASALCAQLIRRHFG